MLTIPSPRALATAAVVGLFALAAQPASAATFGFMEIVDDDDTDLSEQFFVDVEDIGGGDVKFTFRNVGPLESTIAGIYFDDGCGCLDDLDSIINGAGTNFAEDGAPPVLPEGAELDPDFEVDWRINATASPAINGVDPGENVMVIFELDDSYMSLIDGLNDGSFRLGLHVISQPDGTSDSFKNTPQVPVPASLPLLFTAMLGLGFLARRKAS